MRYGDLLSWDCVEVPDAVQQTGWAVRYQPRMLTMINISEHHTAATSGQDLAARLAVLKASARRPVFWIQFV